MRFIEFLTEAKHNVRGQAGRYAKRPSANPQAIIPPQPAAQKPRARVGPNGKLIPAQTQPNPGLEKRAPATGPDTLNLNATGGAHPKGNTVEMGTEDMLPPAVLQAAKQNRPEAIELITLLGAIYQAKRRNPKVQMQMPLIVTQSKYKDNMEALYKVAKDLELPQLAKMSQDIKNVAAAPGSQNAPPAGMQNAPNAPGATPAQQSMLQKLLTTIQNAAQHLSPGALSIARKRLDKAAKSAKPNPSTAQQPIGKPVVTQG